MTRKRREHKLLFAGGGGGGGGQWIEGEVVDNYCPDGVLDIQVKFASDKTVASLNEVIEVEDYFNVMAGTTVAELEADGAKALAGRNWDFEESEWVWHLWLLGGLNECNDKEPEVA